MIMKVNKELIEKLIKRLRSPRSKQTTGALKSFKYNSYCCLGHACVIAEPNKRFKRTDSALSSGIDRSTGRFGNYASSGTLPPEIAKKYFGIVLRNPILLIPPRLRGKAKGHARFTATMLNDIHRFTLSEIADCFEYTFLQDANEEEMKRVNFVIQ